MPAYITDHDELRYSVLFMAHDSSFLPCIILLKMQMLLITKPQQRQQALGGGWLHVAFAVFPTATA